MGSTMKLNTFPQPLSVVRIGAACVLTAVIAAIGGSCGNDDAVTPVKPTGAVAGIVIGIFGRNEGLAGVTIRLRGDSREYTTVTLADGSFGFEQVPDGTYTILPGDASGSRYVFHPPKRSIPVASGTADAVRFYAFPESLFAVYRGYQIFILCGRVLDSAGAPVKGVIVYAEGEIQRRYTSNDLGYYSIQGVKKERVTVYPRWQGYRCEFIPESYDVSPGDESIVVCDFTVVYTGSAVSGRIADETGTAITGVTVGLRGIGTPIYPLTTTTDTDGRYVFASLGDGVYRLEPVSGDYRFSPAADTVTVAGESFTAPDFTAIYSPPTEYLVTGMVQDVYGAGVKGVTDTLLTDLLTGDDGRFAFTQSVDHLTGSREVTVTPVLDGFSFEPRSATVTLAWKENGVSGGTLETTSFTATDWRGYDASVYFPLNDGAHWIYERTADGIVSEHVMSVSVPDTVAATVWTTIEPEGPGRYTHFRIDGNAVHVLADGSDRTWLQFGRVPGSVTDAGQVAGTYPVTVTFLGTEDVMTPAGYFVSCLVFESVVDYGVTAGETIRLWIAAGIGMVRSERTLVSAGGGEHVVDVLTGHHNSD